MIILALDGLEISLVKKFKCRFLQQKVFGQTDINEFSLPKTVILWASFLAGKNIEKSFSGDLWTFKLPAKKTFLRFFKKYQVLDLPACSYGKEHQKEKKLLKEFFEDKNESLVLEEYNQTAWKIHEKTKKEFFRLSKNKNKLLIGYFALADVIGHLNFADLKKMEKVYLELNSLAELTHKSCPSCPTLIISDHGMQKVGRFGDHTMNGFYSLNFTHSFSQNPKITDFFKFIQGFAS